MAKILIIDDDEIQLQLQRVLLMKEGHVVSTTADGPQGITIFKKNRIDLVLLDLGLPSMSGIEVLKEIRRIDGKAKVILIAGYPSVESSVLALRCGACDLVPKPVNVRLLLEKIDAALHAVGE